MAALEARRPRQLRRHCPSSRNAAAFLTRYAPVTQQERWEENAGYSPSTLATVISALLCASDIVRANGLRASPPSTRTTPTGSKRTSTSGPPPPKAACIPTSNTTTCASVRRHPASRSTIPLCPPGNIHIANRGPGEKYDFEAREVIDAGFLELVRYGVRRADDPLIIDSLKVVDHILKIDTPYGPCWRRYNHDGYGQRKDGGPF